MEDRQPECLSQSHKRAQAERIEGEITPAVLSVWRGATCAKSTRELITKRCVECGELFQVEHYKSIRYDRCLMCRVSMHECARCHIKFEVTGRQLRTQKVIICPSCGGENGSDKRGEVTRFSEKSRRELMLQLNTLRKGVDSANFVTLTFGDEYYPQNEDLSQAKEYLRMFEFRFRRAFPGACFVWRMEVEDRKSGEYVGALFPHFHLLTFGVSLPDLRAWVPGAWHEIAGFGSAEHLAVHSHRKTVTPCYSRRAVMGYASKGVGAVMSSEVAKTVQAKGGKVGRWWGTVAKELFHSLQAQPETVELNDGDTVQLFRFFRGYMRGAQVERYLKAVEKARKAKKAQPRHPRRLFVRQVRSMTVFIDGETFWGKVRAVLGSVGAWCYGVTGRRYDEPFWKWAYDGGRLVPAVG